jgi:hypothetical protein
MWLLASDDLPETAVESINGLPLAVLGGNKRDNIGLCSVDVPDLTTGSLSNITTNTAVVTVTDTLAVFEVVYGNSVFTLTDTDTPQPGQFTFDRSTQQITLYTNAALPTGMGVVVRGERNTTPAIAQGSGLPPAVNPALPIKTNYIDPGLFSVFWGLPITGRISWGCSFEQQPSGSISLFVLRESIGAVRSSFAKGKQLQFAGMGFSVNAYNEKLLNTEEFPGGVYEVGVSLTGWYNQYKYLKSVLLKTPFDKDCSLIADGNSITFGTGTATKTKVSTLSGKNGVSVNLFGDKWEVAIPSTTAADATTTWQGEMQSRLRANGAFVSYSSPGVVKAKGINAVSQWNFHVPEFEIAYQGEIKPIHWKVDGQFVKKANNEDEEDTQNKKIVASAEPKWQKKEPFIEKVINGDEDASTCPDVGGELKDPSSNYDQSGPTKSLEISVMMDGSPLSRRNVTFGYAYSAWDIYQGKDGNGTPIYSGAAESFWRIIKDQTENFYYDDKTGYLTGSKTHGWQLVRFKTESFSAGEPAITETVLGNLEDADEEEVAALKYYEFRQAPVNGFSEYYLLQHSDYYKDVEPPPKVQYPVCRLAGFRWVKEYKEVIDPNWVPSMFVGREQRFVNTFFFIEDPLNQFKEDGDPRNPDPTVGEESYQSRRVHILASANTVRGPFFVGPLKGRGGRDERPDRYLEYSKQYSASGPGFNSVAEEAKASQQSGRPGIATRRSIIYERVQPEDPEFSITSESRGSNSSSVKYEFHLLSGKTITDVVDGSVSYPYAKTEADAIKTAETEVTIQRIQEVAVASTIVPFTPSIREFDKVTISTGYDSYRMRVLSFSNEVEIHGQLNGIPFVTSDGTKLSLGLDRSAKFTIKKKAIPQPKITPASDPNKKGLTLGWISNIVLRNRRRPGVS